ncbi:MAG: DHA2 family efflux MFS transporter permease subunit [Candidatus Methanomethylophilaceae archaeon]|nr:DHA2 family efflux MFS transporter permease subunit [Candidatus Methanomethylophilaceae archaeon]
MTIEQITYKNIDPSVRKSIMIGLCLAMLCACFDGTIVGTCGTKIANQLGGDGLFTWMVTAYLLCECITIPIAGKLSDLYGRKPLFLIGLFIFVGGSVVAGMSTNMEMLVICRGVQGLGGGVLIPVATAAIADLYAPHVRARMQGMLAMIFGVGSGVGPIIGGFITENIDWRWCFYINVPIAIVAFIFTIRKFPSPVIVSKPVIDYRGIALLTVFLTSLIILFECGGSEFEWASVQTAALIGVMLIAGLLFVLTERKAKEPVLSPKLLKNRTVMAGAMYMMIFGIGMMGAMTFAGYFGTFILFELDTLRSSYYTLFLVGGMMISSVISGALCERTGYRPWLVIGPIVVFIGLYLFYMMNVDGVAPIATEPYYTIIGKPIDLYCVAQAVLGLGLGCMMTPVMAAVQNSSEMHEIGMNTSAVNLLRSVGTAVGTAVFTMLINAHYAEKVRELVEMDPAGLITDKATEFVRAMIGYLTTLPNVSNEVLQAFVDSVHFGFIAGGCIILLASVIGLFIKAKTTTQLARERKESVEEIEAE